MTPKYQIIWQDEFLAVIDKPPGLVVAPTETQIEPTLADLLKQDLNIDLDRGGLVHRLDKDTSGVMVVAKTQEALDNLQSQFKERIVAKQYLALAHGWLSQNYAVNAPIMRNPGDREKFIVHQEGREAQTQIDIEQKYRLSEEQISQIFEDYNKIQMRKLDASQYGLFTLVKCSPKTGRTHQIRVHLKYINHSLVGDAKYGGRKLSRLDHRWCPRQFLHAHQLEFNHPVTNDRLKFVSPLAADLVASLAKLETVPNDQS